MQWGWCESEKGRSRHWTSRDDLVSKLPCVEVQLLSEGKLCRREQSWGLGDRGEGSLEVFWDLLFVERPNLEGDEILDLKEIIMNNRRWTMEVRINENIDRNSRGRRMWCHSRLGAYYYMPVGKCDRDTIINRDTYTHFTLLPRRNSHMPRPEKSTRFESTFWWVGT